MTANPRHVRDSGGLAQGRRHDFRRWRRSRPFWGGLFTALAGVEIFATTQMSLNGLSFQMGPTGFLSWVIPVILVTCGMLMWFAPQQRMFYAIVGAATAVFSLIGVNLGGFFIGLLLGMVGGALGFAWTPIHPPGRDLVNQPVNQLDDTLAEQRDGQPGTGPIIAAVALLVLPIALALVVPDEGPAQAAPCQTTGTPTPTTDAEPTPTARPQTGTSPVTVGEEPSPATPPTDGVTSPTPTAAPASPEPTASGTPAPTPSTCPGQPGERPGTEEPDKPAGKLPRIAADPGQPQVNKEPSRLTGARVTVHGLRLDGIVDLPTADGTIRTLRLSMDRSVIRDFRLEVPGRGDRTLPFKSSTLTAEGDVEFYTTRFEGRISGIKVTLTPDSPVPPDGVDLTKPVITFDDPEMLLAFTNCRKLSAPGLDQRTR